MKRKLLLRRREVFAREILLNLCRKVYPLSHHLFFLSNFRESGELVYGHACRLRGGGRSVMYIFVHSFRDAPPCCRPSHPSPTSLAVWLRTCWDNAVSRHILRLRLPARSVTYIFVRSSHGRATVATICTNLRRCFAVSLRLSMGKWWAMMYSPNTQRWGEHPQHPPQWLLPRTGRGNT